MSLFRQMWLVIIGSSLLLLSSFFGLSVMIAINELKSEQAQKNIEASKLVMLQLMNFKNDPEALQKQVRAFSRGKTYDVFRLISADGKLLYNYELNTIDSVAPEWFISLFPIDTPPATATIMDNGELIAKVSVSKHRGPAYDGIWNAVMLLFAWMIGGMLLLGIFCSQVLRRIRRPVDDVVEHAEAIKNREFYTVPVSTLPELRPITAAMNDMVMRLKTMFDSEAERLESVRKEAHIDSVTSLELRDSFVARLQNVMNGDEPMKQGLVIITRLTGLQESNRILGHTQTDQLVVAIAKIIIQYTDMIPSSFSGRLNGSEFALFLPHGQDSEGLASPLLEQIKNTGANVSPELMPLINYYMGVSPCKNGESASQILARVDGAVAEAEASGVSSWKEKQATPIAVPSRNHDEWKALFDKVMQAQQFKLGHFPVRHMDGSLLHFESPLRLQLPDTTEWMTAGSFMPMAIRLKRTARLDMAALTQAMTTVAEGESLSVTISGHSLTDKNFMSLVTELLSSSPERARRIWLEVPEADVYRTFTVFAEFCRIVKSAGAKIGVKHFGHQFSEVTKLHPLGLDYLKVDSSFSHEIAKHPADQAFLSGVCTMSHGIGVSVIATGVNTPEELQMITSLKFDAMTGQAVQ